jgi:hypothetical protein
MTEKTLICPHFQTPCIKDGTIVMVDGKPELHACPAWVNVQGRDPQTEVIIDRWNCSQFHWMPFLMIENSAQQRATAAAVESFRNEIVKSNAINLQLLGSAVGASGAILLDKSQTVKLIDGSGAP